MAGIRIEIKRIEKLDIRPKNGKAIITMETLFLPPGEYARILNMANQGVPVQAVIESPQAELDLIFQEVNLKTGEVRKPPEAVYETSALKK